MVLTLDELIKILDIPQDEVIAAILSKYAPPSPPATLDKWRKNPRYGDKLPTLEQIKLLYLQSDFRCSRSDCRSRLQLTIDHIDYDPTNNHINNLRILCARCNRKKANAEPVRNHQVRVITAAFELWSENAQSFPTLGQIRERAGISNTGDVIYDIKWFEYLLNKMSGH